MASCRSPMEQIDLPSSGPRHEGRHGDASSSLRRMFSVATPLRAHAHHHQQTSDRRLARKSSAPS